MLESLDGDSLVDGAVADAALVRAMLDVEAGLVRALERLGIVASGAGGAVTSALADLDVDPADLGRRAVTSGSPVVPLVADLRDAVPDDVRAAVHVGATSQDVLDTALMLCARRAMDPLQESLSRACEAASRLAAQHRSTPMLARTLGQPAQPTTFGLRAAGWFGGLEAARNRLAGVELAAQLGGAAGTLAAYGGRGLDALAVLADETGLADPGAPWHTERSRVHVLAAALAGVTVAAAKVATDVLLMAQAEVAEIGEGSPGGSSSMPHKRNPVESVLLVSAARRAPGLASAVLAAGVHEHERATGSWHAEWVPVRDLLRLAGGAAARVAHLLASLQVDAAAMRRNLDAAGADVLVGTRLEAHVSSAAAIVDRMLPASPAVQAQP